MQKQTLIKTTTEEGSNSNSTPRIDVEPKNTQPNKKPKDDNIPKKGQYKINKCLKDVKFKLKRGKDTPSIHIKKLFEYMGEFKHHYTNTNYYDQAREKVQTLLNSKKPINTVSLWEIFGGQPPAKDAPKEVKDAFLINRMNARVLELIYQRYLMDIVFGSPKIQDKLTTLMFIQEYRKRLFDPLLCGKIECPRPRLPQRKYSNKTKSEPCLRQVSGKCKVISK